MTKAEKRKSDTLELLAKGLTPPDVARVLGITPQRVYQIIAETKKEAS